MFRQSSPVGRDPWFKASQYTTLPEEEQCDAKPRSQEDKRDIQQCQTVDVSKEFISGFRKANILHELQFETSGQITPCAPLLTYITYTCTEKYRYLYFPIAGTKK